MQKDLCWDARRKDKVEEALPAFVSTIDWFARDGGLVVYVAFALGKDDPQFERFGDIYCIEGTRGAEIIDELQPLRGPLIHKRKHSAFFETGLDVLLKEHDVSDVYLAGMQTQICIMTTAADAHFRGYRAIAIEECVLSTREDAKAQALEWIQKYVGEVRRVDDLREAG